MVAVMGFKPSITIYAVFSNFKLVCLKTYNNSHTTFHDDCCAIITPHCNFGPIGRL